MASDAHAHPFDISRCVPNAEDERRLCGIACAASAWGREDFSYNEQCALQTCPDAPMLLTFGVHPQMPLAQKKNVQMRDSLDLLSALASQKRIDAAGECGFDLYNTAYRETETIQNELFLKHIETALKYDLPLVLHVRRAMHKIFEYTGMLKKIKSLVFHSYSGTAGEAQSLLKRGVNAYFSFGNALLLEHKRARECCAALDIHRILFETDAPYQARRGFEFSTYRDIYAILNEAAQLRRQAGIDTPVCTPDDLEQQTDINFKEAFSV
ncbi:MAG: TatD family hydrolase [Spirochaetaceae bacterium]|jgi:TatD DNase family protein|nr:TatD family hydrolase [Spirochaetaceae bacterium]